MSDLCPLYPHCPCGRSEDDDRVWYDPNVAPEEDVFREDEDLEEWEPDFPDYDEVEVDDAPVPVDWPVPVPTEQ